MRTVVVAILTCLLLSATLLSPGYCKTIPFVWDSTNGLRTIDLPDASFHAINDNGLILGSSNDRGFTWDGTTMRDLGKLPGYTKCSPCAINNNGQVIGYCSSSINFQSTSFIWDPVSGMLDLRIPNSSANAINNNGTVCGYYRGNDSRYRPYTWNPIVGRTNIEIPANCDGVFPMDINDNNVIVGYASGKDDSHHGFVLDSTHGFIDVATSALDDTALIDINACGQAVGSDSSHLLIWDRENGQKSFDYLPGYDGGRPTSINDAGEVVGCLRINNGQLQNAFIWDITNGMRSLGTISGYKELYATDINNNGVVVGYAYSPPVPEPSSLAVLFAGIAGSGIMVRVRRRI